MKRWLEVKWMRLGWKIDAIRHKLAWWLLRPQARSMREIVSDVFECETDMRLGPNPIELRVLTGHNQTVNVVNGKRLITIFLSDQQIIVNCFGMIEVNDEHKSVMPTNSDGAAVREVASWMLPYNPEQLRKLQALQENK